MRQMTVLRMILGMVRLNGRLGWHRCWGWLALGGLLALPLAAQNAAPVAKKSVSSPSAAAPQTPIAPPPANLLQQPASAATVTQHNNALTVRANNASLSDILRQVASATGMKLEGLGGDERVFGSFGPAAPGEVLTSLLNGTHYNVMMVGALANGAPRELVLMRKTAAGSTAAQSTPAAPDAPAQAQTEAPGPNADEEEQGAADEPDGPQPAPSIQPAVIPRPGVPEPVPPGQPVVPGQPGQPVAPGQQPVPQGDQPDQSSPRTPQQLLQQIQQQQIQQQQIQQQDQQQQEQPQQDQPPSGSPEPPPEPQGENPPE